jgi:hypothetical protein
MLARDLKGEPRRTHRGQFTFLPRKGAAIATSRKGQKVNCPLHQDNEAKEAGGSIHAALGDLAATPSRRRKRRLSKQYGAQIHDRQQATITVLIEYLLGKSRQIARLPFPQGKA